MAAKLLNVDKGGTFGPSTAASVDLSLSSPSWVPVNGFEWVDGMRSSPKSTARGLFLVRRPGPNTQVEIPKDLHLDFAELVPDQEAILTFAQRYGSLWTC